MELVENIEIFDMPWRSNSNAVLKRSVNKYNTKWHYQDYLFSDQWHIILEKDEIAELEKCYSNYKRERKLKRILK